MMAIHLVDQNRNSIIRSLDQSIFDLGQDSNHHVCPRAELPGHNNARRLCRSNFVALAGTYFIEGNRVMHAWHGFSLTITLVRRKISRTVLLTQAHCAALPMRQQDSTVSIPLSLYSCCGWSVIGPSKWIHQWMLAGGSVERRGAGRGRASEHRARVSPEVDQLLPRARWSGRPVRASHHLRGWCV